MHEAEGEALAMQLAVELVDVGPDNLIWLGGKLEPLLVDIPTDDEDESEDAEPWPPKA